MGEQVDLLLIQAGECSFAVLLSQVQAVHRLDQELAASADLMRALGSHPHDGTGSPPRHRPRAGSTDGDGRPTSQGAPGRPPPPCPVDSSGTAVYGPGTKTPAQDSPISWFWGSREPQHGS